MCLTELHVGERCDPRDREGGQEVAKRGHPVIPRGYKPAL